MSKSHKKHFEKIKKSEYDRRCKKITIKHLKNNRIEIWPIDLGRQMIFTRKAKLYNPIPEFTSLRRQQIPGKDIFVVTYEVITQFFAKKNNCLIGETYEVEGISYWDPIFKKYDVAAIKGFINNGPPFDGKAKYIELFLRKNENHEGIYKNSN